MKRTFLLCSLSIAIALSVSNAGAATTGAESKSADKFSNIDSMINGLEMVSNGGTPPVAPAQPQTTPNKAAPAVSTATVREVPAAELSSSLKTAVESVNDLVVDSPAPKQDVPVKPQDAVKTQARSTVPSLSERLAAEEAEREVAAKKNGETRVSDLPPYSRFDFVRDLFIPANKSGILFIDGKPSLGIESTADPVRVMMERPSTERVCALISDKNYVMMRGAPTANTGVERSYLELAAVSFMEWSPAEGSPGMFVNLRFAPKPAKGVDGKDVNISLQCRIPAGNTARMNETTLNQVNEGFGGLFSFQLPQIIEI
jgi:hypothetical protein